MPKPKRREKLSLAAEVVLVLAGKLCAILALWYFCFGPETRPEVTPESVAQALLSPAAPVTPPFPSGESR